MYENNNIYNTKYRELSKYRNSSVWFAFQDFNLLDSFTVEENILLHFIIWKTEIDEDWKKYLCKYFEIEKLLDKKVSKISGWEKERVSIIKSIIHKPKILLLDEPWNSLNIELKNKLYTLINDYSKDNIVINILHDEYAKDFFELELIETFDNINFYSNYK